MPFYLVTGGAGFIGSNLSEELLKRGNKVRIIDDFSTGREKNIKAFINDIELIEGDIRDINTVRKAAKGIDYILHHAAVSSVQQSIDTPLLTNQVNVEGTLNVLEAARNEGVKRVVIASSAAVYGDNQVLPKNELMKHEPLSPYAVSKCVGELYAGVFSRIYELETVCLRYFNVFGPKQDPKSEYSGVISIFIDTMLEGKKPVIYGDGEQSRDFIYIDNVVEANILAAVSKNIGKGEAINIASGQSITLNRLVSIINKVLKKDIKSVYAEGKKGDIRYSLADISMAEKLLGYEIKTGFEEGLNKTITEI